MKKNEFAGDLDEVIKKIKINLAKYEGTVVRIGLIGRTGCGKSTFINALAGRRISKTSGDEQCTGLKDGNIDRNFIPERFVDQGLEFIDFPGYGTEEFPVKTFMKDFNIAKECDVILLMSCTRVDSSDKEIYKQVRKSKVPIFFVRTKFDQSRIRWQKDGAPESEEAHMDLVCANLKQEFDDQNLNAFVISDDTSLFDFARLKQEIENNLPEIKKQKFIEKAVALTEKDLSKKRAIAEKLVAWMSAASGLTSAIPDPSIVATATAEVGILYNMGQRVLKVYGLSENCLKNNDLLAAELKTTLLKRVVNFSSKTFIVNMLKRAGAQVATKTVMKWVPLVGNFISGLVGFKIASNFGNDVIDHANNLAQGVLEKTILEEAA